MSFTPSALQVSSEVSRESNPSKPLNAYNSTDNCDAERLPAIAEARKPTDREVSARSFSRSSFVLPELNSHNVNQQPVDAGEPHMSVQPAARKFGEAASKSASAYTTSSSNVSSWLEFVTESHNVADHLPPKSKVYDQGSDVYAEKEEHDENKALKRWDYWMEDKKKTQRLIGKQIGREPWDLLMQQADKYREVTQAAEKKLLNCYTNIPKADKWRGCPSRLEPQLRMKNDKTQAQYCIVKTKLESGEQPEFERIGLATLIKKEKGLIPEGVEGEEWEEKQREKEKKKKKKEEESKMRGGEEKKKREKCSAEESTPCKEEAPSCNAHPVEMDELVVIGVKMLGATAQHNKSISPEKLPKIIEPETKDEKPACADDRKSVFCLAIEETEIKYEVGSECCQDPDTVFVWNVDFGVNMAGTTSEKVLRVENRGTMSVKYDWLPSVYRKKPSLGALQPKSYEPWFFFNKNSGYFLPGQIYELKFYFRANTSGVRKETWLLKTTPPFSENVEFVSIALSGVATEELSNERECLDSYLNRRVAESTVAALLNIIVYNVFCRCSDFREIEYRSIFSQKQLFEYHNPQHYYHSNLVGELKECFDKIPCKAEKEWDLSIPTLCRLINTYKQGKERSECFREVVSKSFALLRPCYLTARNRKKYRMTYEILCKVANSMEEDYDYLKNSVGERIPQPPDLFTAGEGEGSEVNFDIFGEDVGEFDSPKTDIIDIKPINYVFLHTMFYLKVYNRACEAVEHIAGVLETDRLFEPWKESLSPNINPPPKEKYSKVPEFCPKEKRKAQDRSRIPGCH